MNICFWGTRMDLLSGHSRPAFELADQLIRMGHRVRIVTTQLSPAGQAKHEALLLRQPHLAAIPLERSFRSMAEMILRPYATQRHLNDLFSWADVFHGFSLPALSLLTTRVEFPVPVVLSLNTIPHPSLRDLARTYGGLLWTQHRPWVAQLLARGIVKRSLSEFDHIICWTQYLMAEAARQGAERRKLTHLPIGLDSTRFELTRSQRRRSSIVFLWLGWATPLRGVEVLLRAFLRALRRLPDARLILADRGPNQRSEVRLHARNVRRLHALARAEGQDGAVCWAGFEANVSALINASDVVVLPFPTAVGYSHPPLTLLEAMAHGKPVIATRIGSIAEYVEDGKEGRLVEPGDVMELEEALVQMASLDRDELGRRAHRRAAGLPSWEEVARRTVGLYESVLASS